MADVTLRGAFPNGANVSIYPKTNWRGDVTSPSGAPVGAAAAGPTAVSGGEVTFTGLTAGAEYYAHAQVGSEQRYVRVRAGEDIDPDNVTLSSAGTLAARPSAASVGAYHLYFATDDNGGTLYQSDGEDWTIVGPRGIELAHDQSATSHVSGTIGPAGTQTEDVTGLSVAFTPRGRPIRVEAGISAWGCTVATMRPRLLIRKSDNTVVAVNGYNAANTNIQQGCRATGRLAPGVDFTEGVELTLKMSLRNDNGSGVVTIYSSDQSMSPFYLSAVEL